MVRATASKFRRIMSAVGTILFIAQGEMRAKPDMKPWENTYKNRMCSTGAALTVRALGLGKCRP